MSKHPEGNKMTQDNKEAKKLCDQKKRQNEKERASFSSLEGAQNFKTTSKQMPILLWF